VEIKIDAAAVEQMVADAVMKSALGDKISRAVHDILARSWDGPIEKALQEVIKDISLAMIRKNFQQQIEEVVKAKVNQATVERFVEALWTKMLCN
jgi:hypothetical protein